MHKFSIFYIIVKKLIIFAKNDKNKNLNIKIMKNLSGLFLATIIIGSLFFLESCKKGEEDPFISLLSRKARVTGEWTIQTNNRSTTTLQTGGSTTIEDFVINGTNIDITTEWKNSSYDTTITIGASEDGGTVNIASIKFEKDGTYSYQLKYQLIDENDYELSDVWSRTITITTDVDIEVKGTWNFLGSVEKDYKNKERIAIVYQRERTTTTITTRTLDEISGIEQTPVTTTDKTDYLNEYANGELSVVLEIIMLKNKEIKFFRDINNYYKYDDGTSGGSTKEVGTETLVIKQ